MRRAVSRALEMEEIMQLLIAHGDSAARLALREVLATAGDGELEMIVSGEGAETLEILLRRDSPALALVDWDLPGLDGPELCRLVRAYQEAGPPYIILLARSGHDIADGLEAGANDCVRTPANAAELRARANVGCRFAALPWDEVCRAPELTAQRTPNGYDAGDEVVPAGQKFELESVLVAQ